MRIGLNMPNFAEFADPAVAVSLAVEAERAGWDGMFIWDHINIFGEMPVPLADPWVLLAAMAQATRKIAIGPMVTPLPRRRPWVLARQTATLDRLSNGRLVMGVGLGLPADTEFAAFGEDPDIRVRAEKLDEGLEILTGLWSGEPFEFSGQHYNVARTRFAPTPVQMPRPPIIVAGTWPRQAPLRRAARWDGYFPLRLRPDGEADPLTAGRRGRDARPTRGVARRTTRGDRRVGGSHAGPAGFAAARSPRGSRHDVVHGRAGHPADDNRSGPGSREDGPATARHRRRVTLPRSGAGGRGPILGEPRRSSFPAISSLEEPDSWIAPARKPASPHPPSPPQAVRRET